MSTLSLVDLAGSESVRLANTQGQRQIEGGFINKSLLTLGKVVSMLTEEGESSTLAIERRTLALTRVWHKDKDEDGHDARLSPRGACGVPFS